MKHANNPSAHAATPSQGSNPHAQGPASARPDAGGNAPDTAGDCQADVLAATPAEPVSYTDAQLSELLFMIEEEKLAGDVYDALYAQTGLRIFDRIGDAEDQHMAVLLDQAQALGLNTDPLISLAAGSYSDPELQSLYDSLMAAASASSDAALQAGLAIEQADIADLELAMTELAGTPLGDVYAHLLVGSNHHLAAFESLLA